ncbi:hypothetical protein ABH995_004902 [Bradyrhizobium yuanmingense]
MVRNVVAPAVGLVHSGSCGRLFRNVRKHPNFQETDAFSGT